MKLIKIKHYVEHYVDQFEDFNPAFVLEMSDGKDYISIGHFFSENTPENRSELISDLYMEQEDIDRLFSSPPIKMSELTNASYMLAGCESLTEFNEDISSVTHANYMLAGCTNLVESNADMSSVTNASYMLYRCRKLKCFNADISNVTYAIYMFDGCDSLTDEQKGINKKR